MAVAVKAESAVLAAEDFDALLDSIRARGYTIIGPRVQNDAIHYGELRSASDLPQGWTDRQEPGQYRLSPTGDSRFFAYTSGAESWKPFLFPPRSTLFRARRADGGVELEDTAGEPAEKVAFLGVRACDLAAIAIQDRVFMGGPFVDPIYAARRSRVLLIAVNCHRPGGTCFCGSMGTGPQAVSGYDLALTEIADDGRHEFLVEAGSETGERIVEAMPGHPAGEEDFLRAREVTELAAGAMGRTLDSGKTRELLFRNLNSPRWQEIAERCLACGNCTMVCPTCFCSAVEDTTDLAGETAERTRRWDSCFTASHSYIHGGSVHATTGSRYRQWMTHKFASWWDQFGSSGCVGCGRCITWCPVGIDITAEIAAIEMEDSRDSANATAST